VSGSPDGSATTPERPRAGCRKPSTSMRSEPGPGCGRLAMLSSAGSDVRRCAVPPSAPIVQMSHWPSSPNESKAIRHVDVLGRRVCVGRDTEEPRRGSAGVDDGLPVVGPGQPPGEDPSCQVSGRALRHEVGPLSLARAAHRRRRGSLLCGPTARRPPSRVLRRRGAWPSQGERDAPERASSRVRVAGGVTSKRFSRVSAASTPASFRLSGSSRSAPGRCPPAPTPS
jgi:hypothetical protein